MLETSVRFLEYAEADHFEYITELQEKVNKADCKSDKGVDMDELSKEIIDLIIEKSKKPLRIWQIKYLLQEIEGYFTEIPLDLDQKDKRHYFDD